MATVVDTNQEYNPNYITGQIFRVDNEIFNLMIDANGNETIFICQEEEHDEEYYSCSEGNSESEGEYSDSDMPSLIEMDSECEEGQLNCECEGPGCLQWPLPSQ